MIGLVVAAAFVAAAGTIAAARAVAGRAERKSVEGYERVLDTLGDVSRRSEARASIHVVPQADLAQPHVRAQGTASDEDTNDAAIAPPRITPILPKSPILPAERLVFVDDAVPGDPDGGAADRTARRTARRNFARGRPGAPEPEEIAIEVPIAVRFDDADDPEPTVPAARRRVPRTRGAGTPLLEQSGFRLVATLVVLAGIGIGAWRIVASPAPAPSPPAQSKGGTTTVTHHKTTPTSTTTPTVYLPSSTTATEVDFAVPAGPIHISFSSSGSCWLGVFDTPGSSPSYQWMDTLDADQTASYEANGKTYVRLGNPPDISVSVNGIPLQLPSSNVQPYNLVLVPTSS